MQRIRLNSIVTIDVDNRDARGRDLVVGGRLASSERSR